MNELLTQIEAILANPEATIEEMAAVLAAVQEALAGQVADDNTDVDEAALVEVVKQLKALEAKINTKKQVNDAKLEVKQMALRNTKVVNALPNELPTKSDTRNRTKVFRSDADAKKSGLFIAAAFHNQEAANRLANEYGIKTLTSTNQASAGILIPDEMDTEIIRLREQYGIARNFATVKTMSSETLKILKEVSGNTAYFIGNGTDATATDPVYQHLTLAAKNLAVRTKYYANLSDDALISLADEITDWAARAIAIKEDQCLLIGDGSATYGGMLGVTKIWEYQTSLNAGTWTTDTDADNNAGIQMASGATWASVTDDDISSLMGKVADYPGASLAFHCTRQFYFEVLHKIAINAGGVTATEIVDGVSRNVFYGYPVIFNNVMSKATTVSTVPLLFGDLKQATYFGDRRGVTIETDKNIGTQEHDVVVTSRFDCLVHSYGNYDSTVANQVPGAIAGLCIQNS